MCTKGAQVGWSGGGSLKTAFGRASRTRRPLATAGVSAAAARARNRHPGSRRRWPGRLVGPRPARSPPARPPQGAGPWLPSSGTQPGHRRARGTPRHAAPQQRAGAADHVAGRGDVAAGFPWRAECQPGCAGAGQNRAPRTDARRKVGVIRLLAVVVVVALVLLPPAPINSSGEPPPAAWEPRPDDSNPAQGRVGRGVRWSSGVNARCRCCLAPTRWRLARPRGPAQDGATGRDELAVRRAPRGVAYEANLAGAPAGRAAGRAGRPPRRFGRV